MPDYGDDRGFRSRGVPSDIGYDRMGGVDRMGGGYDQPFDHTVTTTDMMPNIGRNPRIPTHDTSTPIQMGGGRGEFVPPLYSGRNPFIQPIQTGGRYGEFGGMGGVGRLIEGGPFGEWKYGTPKEVTPMSSGEFLASKFGGGIDDAAGMNDSARGMIEDAGFDVAASEGMTDKRVFRDLWGKAVNKFPVDTPDMIIQQEWERLKQIYRDKKYGVDTGLELPSRDDIVGLS